MVWILFFYPIALNEFCAVGHCINWTISKTATHILHKTRASRFLVRFDKF